MARFEDRDHGFKELMHRLKAAGGVVKVGIPEAAGAVAAENGDGLSVLDVAVINEFGGGPELDHPPARPFMSTWFDENVDRNAEYMRRSAAAVLAGKLPSTEVALNRLGLRMAADLQQHVRAGVPPPNAPSTIAKKGSSTPLIDSGQLIGQISYEVELDKK